MTALVSNRWTHRMAREQLEAQSHQADQQRRFDLRTELREPRQLAYSEFIAQAHRIQELAGTTCRDSDEWKGRILPAVQELGKLGASVAVVGPAAVAARAAGFVQATIGLLRHAGGWVPSERSEDLAAAVALVAPLDAFIEAARKAYEDDGSNVGT
ncbi:hypothetical protein [Streptomyces sp. NPDC001914]|uniref:hypothetical protein n=1 Tax=Streptomyces sp. NPDC001914 TaxID=3364623 RepID=UPI0036CFE518